MAGKLNKPTMLKICDKLATGKSLRSICDNNSKLPHWVTVLQAVQRSEELHEMYVRARAIGAEVLADHMFDLASQPLDGVEKQLANAEVQRRRLEVDTLKWVFARQQPRGIRNKAEDTAANNTIVLSWGEGSDDVAARDEEKDNIVKLVDTSK